MNSDFERECAEERVEQEKEASIAAARLALSKPGRQACDDCGQPIGAARIRVLPSARRCIECQTRSEGRRL
ncbi:molecular chaperone DnaK [Ensifer adhaerens]|nr:molecular chaperone DnaK [Ensifer adhaerens]